MDLSCAARARRDRSTDEAAASTLARGTRFGPRRAISAPPLGGIHLEDSCGAHPPTDTHRHQADAAAATPELVHELGRQLRSGRAKRVTERDRSAVDVHFVLGHAEVAHDRNYLSGE